MTRNCAWCSVALILTGASGCADPQLAFESSETSTSADSTSEVGTDTDLAVPTILDAPEAITPGGLLYLATDQPLNQLSISLDETVLEPERFLMTDGPTGLFYVPSDAPLGAAVLRAAFLDTPELGDERDIEVRAPWFENIADAVGLGVIHNADGSPAQCAESHTGVAWGDYDADGTMDVFLGNVGSGGTLHRGTQRGGELHFQEVSAAVGLDDIDAVAMATFVDLEGDGDADLYIGRRGENRMYLNLLVETGEARFEDVSDARGFVVDSQRTMGVAFGDYDGDGDLDLYEVNHAFCFPQANAEVRARDHLFENVQGVFIERTQWLSTAVLDSVGFSASWLDTDRDGDLDLVVINDDVGGGIGMPNAHWRNDGPTDEGGWRFTEVGANTGLALPGVNGMGLAFGDLNDDGFVDLAFSNIGANHLLLSDGDGTWTDALDTIERDHFPWGHGSITWAVHLPDLDNDGDLDFYATGGRIKGTQVVLDAVFENDGQQRFTERTWSSGALDPGHGKASALVDVDGDGGLDIVTTAWGEPLRVYRNTRAPDSGNHWVQVELQQDGANRDALGAIVTLEAQGRTRTCFLSNRPSLGGGSDHACHFGLGRAADIDRLNVQWPDGSSSQHEPPEVDQRIVLVRE
ncbi:MAG: CRTAC1 family protein [Nannocystaceae bacterium]|nr:CRTAC1 family protein [Nannocystaceae bacterium]